MSAHDIIVGPEIDADLEETKADVHPFAGAAIIDALESVRHAQAEVAEAKAVAAGIAHALAVEAGRQSPWAILPPMLAHCLASIAGMLIAVPFAGVLPSWPRPLSAFAVTAQIAVFAASAVIAFKHCIDASDDRIRRWTWLLLSVAAASSVAAFGAEATEYDGWLGLIRFAAIVIAAMISGLFARTTTQITRRLRAQLDAAAARLAEAEVDATACVAAARAALETEITRTVAARRIADDHARDDPRCRNHAKRLAQPLRFGRHDDEAAPGAAHFGAAISRAVPETRFERRSSRDRYGR